MKKNLLANSAIFLMAMFVSLNTYANCSSVALSIAENDYGDDPRSTKVEPINAASGALEYSVTVGIGNPESGAHRYHVLFANAACDASQAKFCDETQPNSSQNQDCSIP